MEDKHIHVLREEGTFIMTNLYCTDWLWQQLQAKRILTRHMTAEIKVIYFEHCSMPVDVLFSVFSL